MAKDAIVDLQFKKGDMIIDTNYDRIGILMGRSQIVSSVHGKGKMNNDHLWGWKIVWTNSAAGEEVFQFAISRFVDQLTSEHRLKRGIEEGAYQYYTIR